MYLLNDEGGWGKALIDWLMDIRRVGSATTTGLFGWLCADCRQGLSSQTVGMGTNPAKSHSVHRPKWRTFPILLEKLLSDFYWVTEKNVTRLAHIQKCAYQAPFERKRKKRSQSAFPAKAVKVRLNYKWVFKCAGFRLCFLSRLPSNWFTQHAPLSWHPGSTCSERQEVQPVLKVSAICKDWTMTSCKFTSQFITVAHQM